MIELVNPEIEPGWDALVSGFNSGTFFHQLSWQHVLHHTYGYEMSAFIHRSGESVYGILPVMEVRSSFTGNRGVSLPFTDECPTLGNVMSSTALFNAAVEHGLKRNWRYIELRGGTISTPGITPSVTFYGHHVRLEPDSKSLFGRIDSGHRRAIRKAQSAELKVEWSQTRESLREFYRLLGLTRQRHGVPPQPWKFFAAIHRYVLSAGKGSIVLITLKGKAVAGALFVHSCKSVIYKFGASDLAFQHLRANNLVMWSAFQKYGKEGFEILDLGRTSLRNEGLRRFKLGWGATETQISYFKYDLRKREFAAGRDDSSGWHTRVFNFIPRPLAQLIGTVVYKHIA